MRYKTLAEVEATLEHTAFPESIILDTINSCNYSCSICARNRMSRPRGKMSFGLAKRIIDEIADEAPDTKLWLTFYGEPLLIAERVALISQYALSKGVRNVHLNTNASLLDEDRAEIILTSGISQIVVSVDAFYDVTYDKMRHPGLRTRIYDNLNRLLDMARNRTTRPQIIAQIVKCDKNEHEIDVFAEYWKSRGASIKIKDFISWADPLKKTGTNVKRIACPWIFTTCPVLYTGAVALCGVDFDGVGSLGNVHDGGIKGLWNGLHKKVREIHLTHRFNELPEICKNCNDWNILGSELES